MSKLGHFMSYINNANFKHMGQTMSSWIMSDQVKQQSIDHKNIRITELMSCL